jgi:Trk-type K+ transport system membrane component
MDKETLSNYGWVVICVLVLVVMIALATPFGKFIAEAVKSTTEGLFNASSAALNKGLSSAAGVTVATPGEIEYTTIS